MKEITKRQFDALLEHAGVVLATPDCRWEVLRSPKKSTRFYSRGQWYGLHTSGDEASARKSYAVAVDSYLPLFVVRLVYNGEVVEESGVKK